MIDAQKELKDIEKECVTMNKRGMRMDYIVNWRHSVMLDLIEDLAKERDVFAQARLN